MHFQFLSQWSQCLIPILVSVVCRIRNILIIIQEFTYCVSGYWIAPLTIFEGCSCKRVFLNPKGIFTITGKFCLSRSDHNCDVSFKSLVSLLATGTSHIGWQTAPSPLTWRANLWSLRKSAVCQLLVDMLLVDMLLVDMLLVGLAWLINDW